MMSQHSLSHKSYDYGTSELHELNIETLTGTMFEIKISPNDTILSVKMKIQNIEGIPVSQQHLLYNLKELNNFTSIKDCSIPNKAILKLVLSMRVGPITTKRIPAGDELAWRELQELMSDTRKDDLYKRLPPGSIVTVLLFQDGDQISFLKVLQHEDGSFSHLTDSWNGSSIRTLYAGGNPEESARKIEDNTITAGKMQELQEKLEALSVQKREKKWYGSGIAEPDTSLDYRRSDSRTPNSRGVRVISYLSSNEKNQSSSVKYQSRLVRKSEEEMGIEVPPRRSLFAFSKISMSSFIEAKREAEHLIRMQSKVGVLTDHESSRSYGLKRPPLPEIRRSPSSDKEKINKDDKLDNNLREKTVTNFASVQGESHVSAAPSFCSSQRSRVTLPPTKEIPATNALSQVDEDSVSTDVDGNKCKMQSHPLEEDERLKTSSEKDRKNKSDRQKGVKTEQSKCTGNGKKALKTTRHSKRLLERLARLVPVTKVITVEMGQQEELITEDFADDLFLPLPPLDQDLEPVTRQVPSVKKRLRCSKCKKKLNITNTYNCRCGGIFCAVHRYSEVHDCPFDYRREGKKMINEISSFVATSRLPET